MRSRTFRVGKYAMSVTVGRGLRPTIVNGYLVDNAPNVVTIPRSVDRALNFLRGDLKPDEIAANVRKASEAASLPTLAERVEACPWYHTIELPGGVVTKGTHDHRPLLSFYGLPDDLTGQRVIDVATFDGFWAFEFERRNAEEVVAIDVPDTSHFDLPTPVREQLVAEGSDVTLGTGFAIAHEALSSRVKRVEANIYELHPDDVGTFDLVHLSDLLLHLRRPLDALERLRSITREGGRFMLADCFDPSITERRQTMRYLGGWANLQWWLPSLETLVQFVVDAGFNNVEVQKVYTLPSTVNNEGFWRAAIHATV